MPIRVCFVLFVFSIPFEHVQFSELMSDFTFAKMAGILLFCVALLQPMVCFARPPKAFWCFVAYLGVYSLLAFVRVNFGAPTLNSIFTLAQCMIFFWISYNILRQGGMRKSVCAAFVLSNLVVALLTYFGVAATESETGSEIRFSAFGQDENVLGSMYAIGVLSAVALAVDKSVPFLARLSMIPALLLMFAKCASTGSRGAMLSLAVGLLAYLLASKGFVGRIKSIIVVGTLAVVLGAILAGTEIASERWNRTFETGNTAGRAAILQESLGMFLEKPLFGWGPTAHLVELLRRHPIPDKEVLDTHNDIMWSLTATGLAGGVFFIGGLWLCVWGAWKGRRGLAGPFPVALMFAILMMSMTVTIQKKKPFWVVASMAAASGAVATRPRPAKISRQPAQGYLRM